MHAVGARRPRRLIGTLCLLLIAAGCGDSGRGVFQKAEDLFRKGQYDQALQHYRLISESHTNSAFADRALFKQGLILNTHIKRPREARAAFARLIADYPDSQFADDALMALAALELRSDRTDTALRLYQQALERFPDNRDVCAEAQLAVGRIQLQMGDRDALSSLRAVVQDYPDKTSRCAEACYLMGQYQQDIERNSELAVKTYQTVISEYPTSQFAPAARQAIGFIYYLRKVEEDIHGKRVLLQAKAEAGGESQEPLIESLQVCLAAQGVATKSSTLMGLSGLAFATRYEREKGSVGSPSYPVNPLEPACSAFGLSYEAIEARDSREAWARLQQMIDAGQPALALIQASPPRWYAVVGYDQKPDHLLVKGRGTALRRLLLTDFEKTCLLPPPEMQNPRPASSTKFMFFSVSGSPRSGPRPGEITESLERAVRILRGGVKGNRALGGQAWEELRKDLETAGDDPSSPRRELIMSWHRTELPGLRSARHEAGLYLRAVAARLKGVSRERALEAATLLSREEAALARLQEEIAGIELAGAGNSSLGLPPAAPVRDRTGEAFSSQDFSVDWKKVAESVMEITDLERRAAEVIASGLGQSQG